jgi:transcription factor IIIB subunit 2
MQREQRVRENSAAAAAASSAAAMSGGARIVRGSSSLQCPNKACPNPNVVDGTCQTCGRVADDSNIVSEVQFGETSSGAAVVQGSFLGADQGGVRTVSGPAFRRVAGSGAGEARERSLKEAKALMQQYVHRLNLSPALAESGFRLYRMAAMNNFVQGRRVANVVSMCLYAACRKEQNCKVMLIDLADLCKENVFKLGRNYKAFIAKFPEVREGPNPIILEDLIWRFASKLEFYGDTNKVAMSAARIAKRMQTDHMTHGRRPAGICGAALIMAARAHSYRRTVREVVYIAKVTEHTLQVRMDEFANVPSAQMTIDEFHTNDFLDEQYDPPWWYKQTAAWKEKNQRPLKRKYTIMDDDEEQDQDTADLPAPELTVTASTTLLQTDKDGFVIPPLPGRLIEQSGRIEDRTAIASARGGDGQLEMLAREFGDASSDAIPERSTEAAMAAAMGIDVPSKKKRGRPPSKTKNSDKEDKGKKLAFDEQWDRDEDALEEEMEVHLSNPEMISAARDEAQLEGDVQAIQRLQDFAEERRLDNIIDEALKKGRPVSDLTGGPRFDSMTYLELDSAAAEGQSWTDPGITPTSRVSDDPIVREDEFADDPEVINCLLGPEEAKIKEQLWTNENKDWLSANQQKIFKKKMAERGPPKKTRKRLKTARIGEGQASPASSAGEAAVNALTMRAVSKKINYSAFQDIFNVNYHRPGSVYGGTSTAGSDSRAGSVAPSEAGGDGDEEDATSQDDDVPVSENVEVPGRPATADAHEDEHQEEEEGEDEGHDDHRDVNEDVDIDPFANNDDEYGDDDDWE